MAQCVVTLQQQQQERMQLQPSIMRQLNRRTVHVAANRPHYFVRRKHSINSNDHDRAHHYTVIRIRIQSTNYRHQPIYYRHRRAHRRAVHDRMSVRCYKKITFRTFNYHNVCTFQIISRPPPPHLDRYTNDCQIDDMYCVNRIVFIRIMDTQSKTLIT